MRAWGTPSIRGNWPARPGTWRQLPGIPVSILAVTPVSCISYTVNINMHRTSFTVSSDGRSECAVTESYMTAQFGGKTMWYAPPYALHDETTADSTGSSYTIRSVAHIDRKIVTAEVPRYSKTSSPVV